MGFTGLARWSNAPTHGLDIIAEKIIRNHQGSRVGKWQLTVRQYRSTFSQIPAFQNLAERVMVTLTMNDNVFVLLEDNTVYSRQETIEIPGANANHYGHYRSTFVTLKPPGALEQMIAQLGARWQPVRQTSTVPSRGQGSVGQQLTIEGAIFSIGMDWIVRAGNVMLSGGAVKGMLLEVEYLPLPVLHSPSTESSEMLSNLFTSILPTDESAKIVAVTATDNQWEDVLWQSETEEQVEQRTEEDASNDVFFSPEDIVTRKPDDWVGIDRDRRSAFLILGALRSESIIL